MMCGGEKEIAHDCEIVNASPNLKKGLHNVHKIQENPLFSFKEVDVRD